MEYSEARAFIFENYQLAQREVRTSLFGNKALSWIIDAKDKDDLKKLQAALVDASLHPASDFIVRGKTIIFTEKGAGAILRFQKVYETESNPHWITYENLTDPTKFRGYYNPSRSDVMVIPKDNYISINYTNKDLRSPGEKVIAKFHVSLENVDIAKAWNAIGQYLIDHHLKCKIARPDFNPEGLAAAENKAIVLYVTKNNIKDVEAWQQILTDVESILIANHVKPGPAIPTDRPVDGSRYFHLRYGDTMYDRETGKASDWDDGLHQNEGIDSFANLKINVTDEQAARFQAKLNQSRQAQRERT